MEGEVSEVALRGRGEREALRVKGDDESRYGLGEEGEGKGEEKGGMRLGSGMVKKGAGRGRNMI